MESKPEFQGTEHANSSMPTTESTDQVTSTEVNEAADTADRTENPIQAENHWEDHRLIAIVGYIFPVLFFVPLINDESKKSPYALFHAGQQLNILIVIITIYLLSGFFMTMFWSLGIMIAALMQLIPLVLFVYAVLGAISASKGEMSEVPIIGKYRLLK